jgi:hypothetical protein
MDPNSKKRKKRRRKRRRKTHTRKRRGKFQQRFERRFGFELESIKGNRAFRGPKDITHAIEYLGHRRTLLIGDSEQTCDLVNS